MLNTNRASILKHPFLLVFWPQDFWGIFLKIQALDMKGDHLVACWLICLSKTSTKCNVFSKASNFKCQIYMKPWPILGMLLRWLFPKERITRNDRNDVIIYFPWVYLHGIWLVDWTLVNIAKVLTDVSTGLATSTHVFWTPSSTCLSTTNSMETITSARMSTITTMTTATNSSSPRRPQPQGSKGVTYRHTDIQPWTTFWHFYWR